MPNGGLYDVKLLQEVQQEVTEELIEAFLDVAADSMGPDGETFGDMPMTPDDRIAQFVLDSKSGQMDMLSHIAPHFAAKRARQYIEDIKRSPLMKNPTPPAQPIPEPNIWPQQAGPTPTMQTMDETNELNGGA